MFTPTKFGIRRFLSAPLKRCLEFPCWHLLCLVLFTLINSRSMLQLGYPGGTDSLVYLTEARYEHLVGVSTWFSTLDFGQPSTFFQSPLIFAMSIFGDEIVAYKFFVLISFFLSGLNAYFIASKLTGFPLSALVSGLIYMNSQFLFSQLFEGHLDIMFGYALFPLAIYFAYTLFSVSSVRVALYSAFEVFFLFSSHLNIAYIGGIAIITSVIFSITSHRHLGMKAIVGRGVLFTAVGLTLSAFFLVPFLGGIIPLYITYSSIPIDPSNTVSSGLVGSFAGVSMENSFLYVWKNTSYSFPSGLLFSGVSLGGLLLFIGSCISMVRTRDRFSIWLFAALIASILLAAGTSPVFGPVFALFWKYLPFFNTVRFLDRWFVPGALSESLLIAILVNSFRTKPFFSKTLSASIPRATSVKVVLAISMIVIVASPTVFIFAPPSWVLPSEYEKANQRLSLHAGKSSTLIVPFGGVYIRSEDYGVSRNPACFGPLLSGSSIYTGEGGTAETRGFSNFIGNSILSDKSDKIVQVLGWMGTDHFLFSKPSNDSFFSTGWNQISSAWNPNLNYQLLLNQSGLTREATFGNIAIFNNSNSQGEFVISSSPIALVGGQNSLLMVAQLTDNSSATPALVALTQLPQREVPNFISSSSLMFADANYDDLLMLNVNPDYVFKSTELLTLTSGSVTLDDSAFSKGFLVLSGSSLRMSPNSTIVVNGGSSTTDGSAVWIRVGFGPEGDDLRISVGNQSAELSTKASIFQGFRWIEVFPDLPQFEQLSVQQSGSGEYHNYVDALAVVPKGALDQANVETAQQIDSALHKMLFLSAISPNLNSSGFQLSLGHASTNGGELMSGGPSELSVPFKTTAGKYYVYVRHGANPSKGASFSVRLGNQTATLMNVLSDTTANTVLSANGWRSSETIDKVASSEAGNLGPIVSWQLSSETAGANGYLCYDIASIDLEISNYAALNVFGDGSGNALGAYFYDSTNRWIHFSLTSQKGIDWKGWRQIAFSLDSYDCTSMNFNWSNVTRMTFEYSKTPNNLASQELMFTPYAFYHVEESSSDLVWSRLGPFNISTGTTNMLLSTNGSLLIDSIVITDVGTMQAISDLIGSSSLSEVSQLTQTRFAMPIQTNNRSVLIFKQSYHPLWLASIEKQQLQHITVNFALNGFLIDANSTGSLKVWFEGDELLAKGTLVSAGSLIVLFLFISVAKLRKKRNSSSNPRP